VSFKLTKQDFHKFVAAWYSEYFCELLQYVIFLCKKHTLSQTKNQPIINKPQKGKRMAFNLTKKDLKKSATCPPGMHPATLIKVEEPYVKDNGNTVQKCEFETDSGYIIPTWFNANMTSSIFEFVAAADKITFDIDKFSDITVELKDYKDKKVAISISHRKGDDGRIMASIDNFYEDGKVPF
jgi:hypothetical protein